LRLLHTSDWHVGKNIRDRDRNPEFAAALAEVVAIARDQNVDALLVSGDLFEHKNPRSDAEQIVYDTLAQLHAEGIRVVAITGNHDSAVRWTAIRGILGRLGVSVVTEIAPPDQGTAVEVPSRDGREAAIVACVPFAAERYFGSGARLFAGGENWPQDYAQGMGNLLAAMATAFRPDRVNVLLAHLFAAGAALGGGEVPTMVTIDYMVPPARLPGTASYIGLGHIHRPQQISASPSPTYYAGSLLQLDFGERDQRKSVRIVDASPSKPAKVTEIPLTAGRQLVDLEGTIPELEHLAAGCGDAYLRVRVRTDGPVPGIAEQVRLLLPNAVDVRADYDRGPDQDAERPRLIGLRPREQYAAFYQVKYAREPSAEVLATFDELQAAAEAEQ
jgi:exonuclease SbcD